jgi:hypothetical protein
MISRLRWETVADEQGWDPYLVKTLPPCGYCIGSFAGAALYSNYLVNLPLQIRGELNSRGMIYLRGV